MGSRPSIAKLVHDLLEVQHEALLIGNLDVLGQMAPDLECAFKRLAREKASADELGLIKECAARNARLLLAAQTGVSAARSRLTMARNPSLTTYGADGRSQNDAPRASQTSLRR